MTCFHRLGHLSIRPWWSRRWSRWGGGTKRQITTTLFLSLNDKMIHAIPQRVTQDPGLTSNDVQLSTSGALDVGEDLD